MEWALTLGTKTIQILGSYIRDRREYFLVLFFIPIISYLISSINRFLVTKYVNYRDHLQSSFYSSTDSDFLSVGLPLRPSAAKII